MHESALETLVTAGTDTTAPLQLAVSNNEMDDAEHKLSTGIPIKLTDMEKPHCDNEWKTHRERKSRLDTQRGKACSMIRGQCMQVLMDKMKCDPDWEATSLSFDPLTLTRLIEKTTLAQTADQCPFATMHEQEQSLHSFRQEGLSNEQWHERFNAKVDIGKAIGAT